MKALSVRQPWSWLIVNQHKPVENRTWKLPGTIQRVLPLRIAIHAGKAFDYEGYLWVQQAFPEIVMPPRVALDKGGIVGYATLTGCAEESESTWFSGPYGFTLEEANPCAVIHCNGRLGFFEVEI